MLECFEKDCRVGGRVQEDLEEDRIDVGRDYGATQSVLFDRLK